MARNIILSALVEFYKLRILVKFLISNLIQNTHMYMSYNTFRRVRQSTLVLIWYVIVHQPVGLMRSIGDKPHVFHTSIPALQARCSNGGWTVILRRKADVSQQVNFTRTWNDYKHGFGDLNTEFWYGLRNIHCLTTRQQVDLRIKLKYGSGGQLTYNYKHFVVDGRENKFTLHIGQLQQPRPGNDSIVYSNGQPFTTYDEDNDANSGNCALSTSSGKGG